MLAPLLVPKGPYDLLLSAEGGNGPMIVKTQLLEPVNTAVPGALLTDRTGRR